MKNIYSRLLTFLILLLPVTSFSQDDFICGTESNSGSDPSGAYSYSTDPIDLEVDEPLVLRAFIWQVKGPLGQYGNNNSIIFTENDALRVVANLNIEFNQFNIFFKYIGLDSFETPGVQKKRWEDPDEDGVFECIDYPGEIDPEGYGVIDKCQMTELFNYASGYGFYINDALNIYFPYQCDYFGGVAYAAGSDRSIVPYYNIDGEAMIHEVGHNLGLRHTSIGWTNDPDPDDPLYPCASDDCEHVTRTTSDSNYNATCKADMISDTNAVPNFKREHFQELLDQGYTEVQAEAMDTVYKYVRSCIYDGSGDDCEGTFYQIYPEDVTNMMLPALPTEYCQDYNFTNGQVQYMRETIDWVGVLRDAKTEVSTLYEPYTGEYFVSGPIPNDPPLFQPGFDYQFISCSCENVDFDCDESCDFENTAFQNNHTIILNIHKEETDYSIITHPNHSSIYIDQLSPLSVRRCYDNWNKGAIGGSVTLFNDGVINTNVTITPKDSLGINNQNLINDLPQGLYKIEKNYNDGTTQQAIIQKGNN